VIKSINKKRNKLFFITHKRRILLKKDKISLLKYRIKNKRKAIVKILTRFFERIPKRPIEKIEYE